ncbi:glycosyltransferase family 2 protein [Cyanobacteria bacterium FACHB-502]|nr:glycosyltransferase family 2 protein [Cyanobacteria bacterium FACHB-502]
MTSLKASICVAIYNNVNNLKNLFYSIDSSYPQHHQDTEFIVYNDGSTVKGIHEELENFCNSKKIRYIYSTENKGVAYAWNRLTEAANSEIIILLNDDLRVYTENWLDHITYTFENNDRIGIVYWCQRQIDSHTGVFTEYTKDSSILLSRNNPYPYLRHNFCGAFFSFRKSVWSQIIQPDGSIGFWEDLLSYGEEIDLSSEFLNRGYLILQLPTITFEHLRSQTFTANSEKTLRKNLSRYLPLEKFHQTLLEFPDCFELTSKELLVLKTVSHMKEGTSLVKNILRLQESKMYRIPRLDYSMAMLLAKWKHRAILGFDGEEYLIKLYSTGYPSALQDAIRNKSIHSPKNICFMQNNGAKKTLQLEECINYSQESML